MPHRNSPNLIEYLDDLSNIDVMVVDKTRDNECRPRKTGATATRKSSSSATPSPIE
jgi:hypothetical protein